ncbi:hypothetical protein ACEPAF_8882 [Sanghuangporus sanghuang]
MNFDEGADAFSTGLPTIADEWPGQTFDPQAVDASEDSMLNAQCMRPFKDWLPPLPESLGLSFANGSFVYSSRLLESSLYHHLLLEEAIAQNDSGVDFFAQYVDLDGSTLQDTSNGCSGEGTGETAGEKGATSRQYREYEEVTVEASADPAAENESTVGRRSREYFVSTFCHDVSDPYHRIRNASCFRRTDGDSGTL